ncbi:glycosyltransferase [Jiangella asiatica]|uniref:Glycosyltransferase n=1 Tax=Jiangella asiatica TaxID=2530372 RepID=A0A4R5D9L5_9ACTN|nr:glycosyltransferase [Jiangella asiatica]TDE08114.1 glycosyltransferase [Jiangella asiatica]
MTIEPPAYVLPLRWTADVDRLAELTGYLAWLRTRCRVVVVDGSPPELFARHRAAWAGLVTHLRPDDELRCRNGKVHGVRTGLRRATGDVVVIADDDVRYDEASLASVLRELDRADVVVPQNVFEPLPWHARWDSARSLVNRAFGTDYPGTLGVRRHRYDAAGGYDGDVLFENLELIRTMRAAGATVRFARGVFVRRRPPTVRTFWSQRVRQAFDSLAQPGRLAAELAILPAGVALARRRQWQMSAAAVVAAIAIAEAGRRRDGGTRAYPASAALWAPAWVLERGVCSWVAVAMRVLAGGVSYAGTRLAVAAHSQAMLDRAVRDRAAQDRAALDVAALTRRSGWPGAPTWTPGSPPRRGSRRRTA